MVSKEQSIESVNFYDNIITAGTDGGRVGVCCVHDVYPCVAVVCLV